MAKFRSIVRKHPVLRNNMHFILIALLTLSSCGKKESSDSKLLPPEQDERQTPPVVIDPPAEIDPSDVVKITDLLPTMYYTAEEEKVSCKGKYGTTTYNGTEKSKIKDMAGNTIATVCTRFYRVLLMEGSAILKDRGQGKMGVNYSAKIGEDRRYHKLERCTLGEGVKKDLCLLPYHTLASDNTIHAIGEIIYIPNAAGLKLPDDSIHDGYFIVRDTGSAFNGIGAQRVDMFTGLDPDYNNAFQRAGFHHKKPMGAFKIKGNSAEVVKEKLRQKFGDLY